MSTKHLKAIVLLSIGVGSGVVLLLFLLPTHTTPKIEIQEEIIYVSPRVFRSRSMTPQESLKDFQQSEFYRTIVDNNLFRPLGWTPPRPREPYRLIGTLLPTDGKSKAQAILQKTPTGSTYTVTIGETLGTDTTVIDIQPKQVTLSKASVKRSLTLNTTPLLK